ncbi:MAG: hypothetical protein KJ044_02960, partial [Planctomycetes bacterium]|nr:hypothetical protein [Planctomycetota bacterium]
GPLRGAPGLTVRLEGETAWVRWSSADATVVSALLPAPGAAFFERRDGHWLPCGARIPVDVPTDDFAPLASLLFPQPVSVVSTEAPAVAAVRFHVARSDRVRPCTAVVCTPATLAAWAGMAPDAQIGRLVACRSGNLALVLGTEPPWIPGSERYWGQRVLLPLGWRAEPELPPDALCEAAGCEPDDLLLWRNEPVIVPRRALAPLTRAAARLGARDGA